MVVIPDEIVKILLAILVGGLIGAEREFRHRAAGFRTIIFICLGSTLFTMFSLKLGGEASPVRIAAHMVTGVGFLCAGVIMEEGAQVVGLTTASTIWLTAALGMGIGGGQYMLSILALIGGMIILLVFPRFEEWIYNIREGRTYEVVSKIDHDRLSQLEDMFEECGLNVKSHKLVKMNIDQVSILNAFGSPACHDKVMEKLLDDVEVKEFRY